MTANGKYSDALNERHKMKKPPRTSIDKLRESFVGMQKAMNIVAAKDNVYPKIKLWYPAPSFSVIVISPVDNNNHNYIFVQTYPCTNDRATAVRVFQRSRDAPSVAYVSEGGDSRRSSVSVTDKIYDSSPRNPLTYLPSIPGRQTRPATSPVNRDRRSSSLENRRTEAAFTPSPFTTISRLPEDLELELQML
jgi:hypothetical protein